MIKSIVRLIIVSFCLCLIILIKYDRESVDDNLNLEQTITDQTIVQDIDEVNSEDQIEEETDHLINNLQDLSSYNFTDYDISIVYNNYNTDQYLVYNEASYYYAGSIIKVFIATMLADKIENNLVSPNDVLYYDEKYYEEGTGSIQFDIQESYTVIELIDKMLIESDNIATNMLLSLFEPYEFSSSLNELTNNSYEPSENKITGYGSYLIIKHLYDNENNNQYYDYIIEDLKNTIFDYQTSLYLENDQVAHKIGSLNGTYNDIAIIYGESPFLIAVLCNEEFEICNEITGELTKNIYNLYN